MAKQVDEFLMEKRRRIGRVIGGLLLIQMVGLTAGFIMLKPGVGPDFLTQATGLESQIRVAVLLLLANAGIALAIGVSSYATFTNYSSPFAIALVAIATGWVLMRLVDSVHILSMLSLSQRFAEHDGAKSDLYNLLADSLRSTRNLAHYGELLVIDVWFGLFYGALFLFRLVPRLLALFGLLAVALHLVGLPLAMFLGYPTILPLAYGIGLSYLLIGGWLVAKGLPAGQSLKEIVGV
ncbi:MAG: DUF4386 family protein [Chlorobia bacterium]|nr:DUF4386 family protein [Fimbriimonadaceae bacterium]